MPVTIKDVAKLAGVSPSTVTRVIQNKSSISDATKSRVRAAMKELNYHPNLNARSLVSKASQVIGLVLPDDSDAFYQNPFFPAAFRGIAQEASKQHYAIQIATGMNREERLQALSQMVLGRRVDGLIFLYAEEDDPLVALANEENFPYLILGKSLSPYVNLVDNDNFQAGYDACRYFIDKGLKDIAFLAGPKKLFVSQDRYQGYQEALREAGLVPREETRHFASEFSLQEGYHFVERLAAEKELPQALITTDNLLAEGACQYLAEHRIPLPILTFDAIHPKLNLAAYIDINSLELGQTSARTIIRIINDHKEQNAGNQLFYRQLIPHHLVEQKK